VPLYRDEAVVLRTHKLGEADRIVTMLSREHGKIRAVAKGVRRTASKFGARLEPFMVADVQLFEGRTLDIITQAETLGAYGGAIASDYSSYTAATAMVETADKVTDDDGSLQQYLLLVGALRSLSRGEHEPSLTLDSYLLRSLSIAGWAPSFVDCAVTGAPGPHSVFVVQMGGVVADAVAPPGAPRLDQATLGLLSSLLAGDWEAADATGERTRNQASGVVAAYTQFHLERGLRSLRHVDRTPGTRALTAASSAPPTTLSPLRSAPTVPTSDSASTGGTAQTDPTENSAPSDSTARTDPTEDGAPDAPTANTQAGATS
jgi:DNA repair protein RecO (recombination protein O)